MKLRRTNRETPDLDIGAFADIAFLLIIFFILTTTFVTTHGRKTDVPSGKTSTEKEQQELTVNLTKHQIQWGEKNEQITFEQFRERLAEQEFEDKPKEKRMVILDAKSDVPYQKYYKVMVAISNAGGVVALIDHSKD